MNEENTEYRHVECLIDMLKNEQSTELKRASETISLAYNVLEEQTKHPSVIQYTHGVGNFAVEMANCDIKTAILFDNQESIEFAKELSSERSIQHLSIIDSPLSIDEYAFPMSPDGNGWSYIILDDIVPYIGGDIQLVALLKAIHLSTSENAKLIIRLPNLTTNSWNREYNKTVVTESTEKVSIRRFKKTITAHGEVQLRHAEDIYNFAMGDIHESARSARFRPTRDLGLDPSVWCCYERV